MPQFPEDVSVNPNMNQCWPVWKNVDKYRAKTETVGISIQNSQTNYLILKINT